MVLYRSGLVTAAASFVVAASGAFLPDTFEPTEVIKQNLDLAYLIGAGGLGLSLVLIHIYVTEIKRTLQALWALGVVGSLVAYTSFAGPAGQGLVEYVIHNPTAIWFVGPLFAALTGLVFKEGIVRSDPHVFLPCFYSCWVSNYFVFWEIKQWNLKSLLFYAGNSFGKQFSAMENSKLYF